MANENRRVVGTDLATEPAPVDAPDKVWHIVENGIMINPTFTIMIKARQAVVVRSRDIELEIDRFGLSIRDRITEMIIDPRYNTAELKRNGKLIAISDKVRYKPVLRTELGKIYEAREFAELVKAKVKELIEESINITAFS